MKKKTDKKFDALAFKRDAQSRIYEEIKNLSPEEQIAYFRHRVEAGPFSKLWQSLAPPRPSKSSFTKP